jgi:hypothetical protein
VLKIVAEYMFWSLSPLPADALIMVSFSSFSHCFIFYFSINAFSLSSTISPSLYPLFSESRSAEYE